MNLILLLASIVFTDLSHISRNHKPFDKKQSMTPYDVINNKIQVCKKVCQNGAEK